MLTSRALVPALAVLAVLGLAACTPDPVVTTPTPTALSEDEAYAQAEAALAAYVAALNAVDVANPATFEPLFALSTGDQNAQDRQQYSTWHADHWTQVGEAKLTVVEPSALSQDESLATLSVCLDVSAVDLLDADGQSVIDADRVDVQTISADVEQLGVGDWRISQFSPRDGEPSCS